MIDVNPDKNPITADMVFQRYYLELRKKDSALFNLDQAHWRLGYEQIMAAKLLRDAHGEYIYNYSHTLNPWLQLLGLPVDEDHDNPWGFDLVVEVT